MADLLESVADGVAVLTLNRPDRLNALSEEMVRGLCDALPRLASDPAVGAIILTGSGRGFCAGGDVKRMTTVEQTVEERQEGLRWRHESVRLLRTIGKVVIAAVNGPAAGAGLSIALACDLRIAARSARFRTAFAAVGFSGDFGGSVVPHPPRRNRQGARDVLPEPATRRRRGAAARHRHPGGRGRGADGGGDGDGAAARRRSSRWPSPT